MAEQNINEIVEQAFEAEEKAVTEEKPAEAVVEIKTEEKPAETVETKPVETATEEKPADETAKAEEKPVPTDAPKQVRREFVDSHWNNLDDDTKAELTRMANENERNYIRASEAEHATRQFKKVLQPVQGYISEVAQQSNISENEVVRNCVDLIQKLNDNPTVMARQMIANGNIVFDDPVSVINTIARAYNIDVKGDMVSRNIPENMYNAAAQARYEARQTKYAQSEDNDDSYITDYINNTPGIKALLDNEATHDKFLRQVTMERSIDPNASDITIMKRAAEMFDSIVLKQPEPTAEEQKQAMVEKKLAKVVSPTASNPVEQAPVKKEPLTPEQSVRETLRAMGLDD